MPAKHRQALLPAPVRPRRVPQPTMSIKTKWGHKRDREGLQAGSGPRPHSWARLTLAWDVFSRPVCKATECQPLSSVWWSKGSESQTLPSVPSSGTVRLDNLEETLLSFLCDFLLKVSVLGILSPVRWCKRTWQVVSWAVGKGFSCVCFLHT